MSFIKSKLTLIVSAINTSRQLTSGLSPNKSFKIRLVAFGVAIAVLSFVLLAIGLALSDFASVWAYLMLGDTFAFFLLTVLLKREVGNDKLFYKHFSVLYGFVFFPLMALTYAILALCFSILLEDLTAEPKSIDEYNVRSCGGKKGVVKTFIRRTNSGPRVQQEGAARLQRHNSRSGVIANPMDERLEPTHEQTDAERVAEAKKFSPTLRTVPSPSSRAFPLDNNNFPFDKDESPRDRNEGIIRTLNRAKYVADKNGNLYVNRYGEPILTARDLRPRKPKLFFPEERENIWNREDQFINGVVPCPEVIVPEEPDFSHRVEEFRQLMVVEEFTSINQGNLTERSDATVVMNDSPIDGVEQEVEDTRPHHQLFDNYKDQLLFCQLNENRTTPIGVDAFYAALNSQGFRDLIDNIDQQLDKLSYSQKNAFEIMFLNPHKNVSSYDWVTLVMGEIIQTLFDNQAYPGRHVNHVLMSALGLNSDDMYHQIGTIPQSKMAENYDGTWSQIGMAVRSALLGSNSGKDEFDILIKYLGPTRGMGPNCDPVFIELQSPGMASFNTSGNLLVPSKELEKNYVDLAEKVYLISTKIQSGVFKLHGCYESVWNKHGSIIENCMTEGQVLSNEQISVLLKDMIITSCKEGIWKAPHRRPRFNLELFLEGNYSAQAKIFGNEFGRTKTLSLFVHYDHISIFKKGYPTISATISELRKDQSIPREDLDKFEKFFYSHPLVHSSERLVVTNSLQNVGK